MVKERSPRIDVALLPSLVKDATGVFAVVDVLRASSTIVTLLEHGVTAVVPAASVEEARSLRQRLPDYLLCGERDSLPPPGFDHGNSPAELASVDLRGGAILATSNGTRVLNQLAEAPAVLVGALLNREAVAAALLALAHDHDGDVTVVCAAAPDGRSPAMEDALGAGAIVDAAMRGDPSLDPTDAARLARDAFLAHRDDMSAALASARHGAELIAGGFSADVDYCARLDASPIVPQLSREPDGLLILTTG